MIVKRKSSSGMRYTAKVYVGVDSNGKSQYRYGTTRETRSKALEDELALQKIAERKYVTSNSPRPTYFEDAVAMFRESKKYTSYAPRTIYDTENWLRKELIPVFGGMKLTAIKTSVVEKWVYDMDTRYASSTWSKPKNIMSNIMSCVKRAGVIVSNPFEDAELPAIESTGKALNTEEELPVWSPEEIKTFLDYAKDRDYIYPMLLLSFSLALRPGEVVGIKIGDLGEDTIRINQGIDLRRIATNLKTKMSHRILPISKELHDTLAPLAGNRGEDEYLFLSPNTGDFVSPSVFSKRYRALRRKYNSEHAKKLPDMCLYGARHSWSTNAAYVYGVDPAARAAVMGHSSTKTAEKNYTKITKENLQNQLTWY